MRIAILVAMDRQGVIGREGGLPWRLPKDLQRVKALTVGKPVVMGRTTFDTIGRPLPRRPNIVLTRNLGLELPGCVVVHDVHAALEAAKPSPEVWILGGSQVYAAFLPRTDLLYLTVVEGTVEGDTVFPAWNPCEWELLEREEFASDERHAFAFRFETWARRPETKTPRGSFETE